MRRLVDEVLRLLAPRAQAIFVRTPAIDRYLPDTSDLDFIVFADVEDLYPERLGATDMQHEFDRSIDLTWLPARWLSDPEFLATHGLIAHRLVTSDLVFSQDNRAGGQQAAVEERLYRPDVHERRLAGFFEMASLTVREIGVTWDFPAVALFWLHMAHAACLAAALDGSRRRCPNVYTRPFDYLAELEQLSGLELSRDWIRALQLDADPLEAISAVKRVHAIVAGQFPEPVWPPSMRTTTRREYRYWLDVSELQWRTSVAEEMLRRGHTAAAVYWLRFYAYALARAPMVHARASEGLDVSFLRPERAVRPDLERICPGVIEDLNVIFTGSRVPLVADVDRSLVALHAFRERVVEVLRGQRAPVPTLSTWAPYRRPSRDSAEALCQT